MIQYDKTLDLSSFSKGFQLYWRQFDGSKGYFVETANLILVIPSDNHITIQRVASARASRFCHLLFKIFHQLVGRYCSYLLPKQVLGTHEEKYDET